MNTFQQLATEAIERTWDAIMLALVDEKKHDNIDIFIPPNEVQAILCKAKSLGYATTVYSRNVNDEIRLRNDKHYSWNGFKTVCTYLTLVKFFKRDDETSSTEDDDSSTEEMDDYIFDNHCTPEGEMVGIMKDYAVSSQI